MRRQRMVIAALVLTLLAGTVVQAHAAGRSPFQGPPPHGGPGFFQGMERFLELRLTPDQQERIQAVLEKYRDELHDAFRVKREARRNLMTVMDNEGTDEAAVRKAFQAAASAEEDWIVLRHKLRREIASILTPKQRALLSQWHPKRRHGVAPPRPAPAGDEGPMAD
ncbi:Heavy-metal resistance [Desulfacinum hydrothermale DSM 13146]|uniref:Heavy-metal resistance n=1 Tax=Desulfacinum hydrothermale DSM 13146 TaxID=1121390 RepID=A0A1W1XDA5_9BACT|nr:Spy/CpxP family protein refolding chaperone [Desulfacinum hydrothermale]SMC21906.1 Heavy-metal resistance [Desulfacinum hydrothermale DSM 13146]